MKSHDLGYFFHFTPDIGWPRDIGKFSRGWLGDLYQASAHVWFREMWTEFFLSGSSSEAVSNSLADVHFRIFISTAVAGNDPHKCSTTQKKGNEKGGEGVKS